MAPDTLRSMGRPKSTLTPAQERAVVRAFAASVRARARADARLQQRLREIIDGGAPVTAVAERLGFSRQTLYAWLGRSDDDSLDRPVKAPLGSAPGSSGIPSREL